MASFLGAPHNVRPFGFYPGAGSRQPDFMLTEKEIEVLVEFLMGQKRQFDKGPQAYTPEKLSVFSMAKAKKLLQDKLPCLGCHQLGDEGGRIGPDLSSLNTRLQDNFVYQIVRDPKGVISETNMPRVGMPQKTLKLIVDYLLQQETAQQGQPRLSLTEQSPVFHQGYPGSQGLYVKHCSSCHGTKGKGDGYNARFLPIEPTKHADPQYMSTRPDDTLFDGIYAGGYILDKSQRMPSWGLTLSHDEIRQLVAHIRQLCQCEGPAWSRDDKKAVPKTFSGALNEDGATFVDRGFALLDDKGACHLHVMVAAPNGAVKRKFALLVGDKR
ncbi:cytochrome c [Acidobacteriota bacterium]